MSAVNLLSSETNEWYTPRSITDGARVVMGEIDLDPASNDVAQSWIQAKKFYTIAHDGFNKPWSGRMWLNPPYGIKGKGNHGAGAWIEKAIAHYQAGNVSQVMLLVRGDSAALSKLQGLAWCCEPFKRIAFIDANGNESSRPVPGCRIYYLGDRTHIFHNVFSGLGVITRPAYSSIYEDAIAQCPYQIGDHWMFNRAYQGEALEEVAIASVEFMLGATSTRPIVWVECRNGRRLCVENLDRLVRKVDAGEVAA